MKRISSSICATVFVLLAGAAGAQTLPDNAHAGVAFKLSTLGIGFDVATAVHPRMNVRAGFTTFGLSHEFEDDGVTLAAEFQLRSVSASLDWFPFGGGFHVSPGLMVYNGTEVRAAATVPAGRKFSLGDDELFSSAANPIGGTMRIGFERVAPTLTVGWGNLLPRSSRRWSIPFEIGLAYSRSPKATLNLTGSACDVRGANCRSIAADAQLQRDLIDEQNTMNSDLSGLKIIPILSLGFSYRF